jgi:hypothetical protein
MVTETLKKQNFDNKRYKQRIEFAFSFQIYKIHKLNVTHQNLWAWENFPYFRKSEETPLKIQAILMKITPSD